MWPEVKHFPLFAIAHTFLGEDAASVIAPEEHEQALFDAGIFFHHFRVDTATECGK
ncbi:hypothetical protein O5623_06360 [Escherichia coli]|nr:hypothetical protein [Escherichia coli]